MNGMNEMIEAESRDLSGEVSRANIVHGEIMASKKQVAVGIYELARGLKTMRDEKLYSRLDCEDFETYCEKLAKVNVSQAYKYIKVYEELGGSVLQSSGNLGIEKLFLITQLPYDEKNDALDDPSEIEGMSVRELREFVANAKQQGEQLTFLEHELEASDKELRERDEKLSELDSEHEEYRRETEDQIAALRAANEKAVADAKAETERLVAKAEANAQLKVASETERLRDQFEKRYKQKIEDAKAEGEKLGREKAAPSGELIEEARAKGEKEGRAAASDEYEKLKAEYEKLSRQLADGKAENESLQKSLKNSTGSKMAVKAYMDQILTAYQNAAQVINDSQEEEKVPCANAMRKFIENIYGYAVKLCDEVSK